MKKTLNKKQNKTQKRRKHGGNHEIEVIRLPNQDIEKIMNEIGNVKIKDLVDIVEQKIKNAPKLNVCKERCRSTCKKRFSDDNETCDQLRNMQKTANQEEWVNYCSRDMITPVCKEYIEYIVEIERYVNQIKSVNDKVQEMYQKYKNKNSNSNSNMSHRSSNENEFINPVFNNKKTILLN